MIDAHIELHCDHSDADLQDLLDQLAQDIEFSGVDQVLAVQRQADVKLNAPLMKLAADSDDLIAGCVTWIPISSGQIKAYLDEDSHRPLVRGYQETFRADDPDFDYGVHEITHTGKTLELFIEPTRLPEMIAFADKHPSQRFIVDFGYHGASQKIPLPDTDVWARQIRELARRPQVFHRLSSLANLLEGQSEVQQTESVQDHFDTLLSAFTPERIMYGSGWSMGLSQTSYPNWLSTVDNLIHALSDSEKRAIYHYTAAEFYQLESPTGM